MGRTPTDPSSKTGDTEPLKDTPLRSGMQGYGCSLTLRAINAQLEVDVWGQGLADDSKISSTVSTMLYRSAMFS